MNRFANPTPEARPSPRQRRAGRQALTVFLSCLLIGAVVVSWRMIWRADNARARARTEALARALAIEAQFNQAIAAADVLGMLARQSGGVIPNFRQDKTELYLSRPSLATLELQPGGVVSDIVPRAGFERAIGFNVFANPAYHPGAQAALQARQLTLSGPLPLYRGEPGLVARVPVFQRARDGREVCWGFVAVSLRLQEALSRARLDGLAAQGYDYLFFAPEIAGQRATTIAKLGQSSFSRAEQQIVRAQNLEFRLAVQPRHGWVNWTRILVEGLGVLGVSALVGLLLMSVQKGRGLGAALAESENRLARGTTEGKQAREELLNAKETAEMSRAKLNQAEQIIAQLKQRLETTTRSAQETAEADREKLQQAEATIEKLQTRLDAADRQAKESAEATATRLSQTELTIADLQARLEAAVREAKASDKASRAKLHEAEETIRELKSRQRAAEETEAQVVELTALLNEAQAALKERKRSQHAREAAPPGEVASSSPPSPASDDADAAAPKQKRKAKAHDGTEGEASQDNAGPTPEAKADFIRLPVESASPGRVSPPESTAATSEDPPAAVSLGETNLPVPPQSEAEPLAPSQPATAVPEASQSAAPAAPELAAKPVKRKKARHDNQMSLFGEGRAAAETASAAESHPPSAEPPSPPVTARPAEAEKSAPAEIPEADPARTRPAERPPTSAPTAAELDLPEIDGLNIGDGFSLAHGDPKAYLKSLRHFTESQAGAAEKIRDLLVTGDRATAGQLARRLKSEASDIGAEALQGAAADLEWAIRNQSDPEAIESVWAALDKSLHSLLADLKLALKPKEEKRAPVRPLPPSPPVNLSQLRMAVSEILPLLTGHDPGAKDCLKDNRTPFRSAFSPEGFVEFEQTVKGGDYAEAVQQLKRAARKHGISA